MDVDNNKSVVALETFFFFFFNVSSIDLFVDFRSTMNVNCHI